MTTQLQPEAKGSTVINNSPQRVEAAPETFEVFDIDDLIPDSLKKAVADEDAAAEKIQAAKAADEEPPVQRTKDDQTVSDDEDLEFDLAGENVDKLLSGDLDAVIKKKDETPNEETPFWHEDETYQGIVKKLSYAGLSQKDIDTVIESVSAKKVIDKSTYIQGIEKERDGFKTQLETSGREIERLRVIENSKNFDDRPENVEKFQAPMTDALRSIKGVLDLEGITTPIGKFAAAKNKTEFAALLQDADLDDKTLNSLTNHWRNYKEIEGKYLVEKDAAKKLGDKALNLKIEDKTIDGIVQNALLDFMGEDEKYGYIKTAVNEGAEKHPETFEVLAKAKNNFKNILKAIESPRDALTNSNWLAHTAKFYLNAAHNKHIETKHHALVKEHKTAVDSLKKVVKEYRNLAESAKTFGKTKKGTVYINGRASGEDRSKADADEYQKLLKGEIDVSDILELE